MCGCIFLFVCVCTYAWHLILRVSRVFYLLTAPMCVYVCVCVCVCERERKRERVSLSLCVCVYSRIICNDIHVCVCVCVRICVLGT